MSGDVADDVTGVERDKADPWGQRAVRMMPAVEVTRHAPVCRPRCRIARTALRDRRDVGARRFSKVNNGHAGLARGYLQREHALANCVQCQDGEAGQADERPRMDARRHLRAVASRAPGKPLPAGGGPAGKALLDLVAALGGKSLAPILAGLTPDRAKSYQESYRTPAENLESAKDILGARLPKKPKITGAETLADDHVVLEVEGEPFANSKMLYLVEVRLVDSRWRYDDSSTVGMLR